jgi:hypothetical protein
MPQAFPDLLLGRQWQMVFAPDRAPIHPTHDAVRSVWCRRAKAIEMTAQRDFVLLQLYDDHSPVGKGSELYQAWVAVGSISAFVPLDGST